MSDAQGAGAEQQLVQNVTRVAITGASGYVGGVLAERLPSLGWIVRSLGRTPAPFAAEHRNYSLEDEVELDALRDCDALIHCAHDFHAYGWDEIRRVNGDGSLRLFSAARAMGVQHIIFVSSMSAFDGCRSDYGRVKLLVEEQSSALGVHSIRPGLVYGDRPAGMVGALSSLGRVLRVVPLPDGGMQPVYLTHESDLCRTVELLVRDPARWGPGPITLAFEGPCSLRDVVVRAVGRQPLVTFAVPSKPVLLALRAAERFGLRARLRSDGLVGLVYADPTPDRSFRREMLSGE